MNHSMICYGLRRRGRGSLLNSQIINEDTCSHCVFSDVGNRQLSWHLSMKYWFREEKPCSTKYWTYWNRGKAVPVISATFESCQDSFRDQNLLLQHSRQKNESPFNENGETESYIKCTLGIHLLKLLIITMYTCILVSK